MRFILTLVLILVPFLAQAARIELTGPTLFYVSTAGGGNDANDGLTPSTPKLTTNAMLAVLQRDYDFKCYDVQVLHAASAQPYAPVILRGGFTGQCDLPIRLVGQTTRGAVVINGLGGSAFFAEGKMANVLIEGFTLQATWGGLQAGSGATIYYRDIEFLNAAYHVISEKNASLTFYLNTRSNGQKSNYFITGSAISHLYCNGGGECILTETVNGNGIEFIGTGVGFTVFADAIQGGNITAHTNSFVGTVNNYPSLYVRWNSVGGYETQLPGNWLLNTVDSNSMKMH